MLSSDVLRELAAQLEPLTASPPRGVVIHSGKPSGFIMGADINEFTRIENPEQAYELIRQGQQVLDRLASLPCPTVAVVNGFALGGGLELAMACDYRLALQSDRPILGLPEVKLGIHPGFGGTVRAVRLAGVRAAMRLMLTGDSITVDKARHQGLVDRVVEDGDWQRAARDLVSGRPQPARAPLLDRLLNFGPVRPLPGERITQAGSRQGTPRALPGAVGIDRPVATTRREWCGRIRGRGALDCSAHVHTHIAQPGARLLPAESPEGPGRQIGPQDRQAARRRRRGHGRRYCRMVRVAWPARHAGGSRGEIRASGHRACPQAVCQEDPRRFGA
ncbi:MAG: enoyl-CoA hydratase/isomerase family protein [Woeseiaceae bacterium]|nr:enoyl-CoA hydratase/isomerase family protein [Woeseiaceae bacterium]